MPSNETISLIRDRAFAAVVTRLTRATAIKTGIHIALACAINPVPQILLRVGHAPWQSPCEDRASFGAKKWLMDSEAWF
jgi:hypothetical protein